MIAPPARLRMIKDEEEPGPDGTTIKARLQELVKRTADDIKTCANACDTYSKKKLLVKVLKSSSWDDKFKGFLSLFTDRRKAFTFALEMHVGKGVDDANRKLDSVNTKLNLVLEFFTTLVPPDQQQLGEMINSRGGPDAVMQEVEAAAGRESGDDLREGWLSICLHYCQQLPIWPS